MRTWTAAMLACTVAAMAVAGPLGRTAVRRKPVRGKLPTFEFEGYELRLESLDSRSKIDLAERGQREHTIQLGGKLLTPKAEDVAAITRELTVLRAVDAEGNNLLPPKAAPKSGGFARTGRARPRTRYRANTYVGVHDHQGEVEVSQTKLRRSAYTLGEMELAGKAIVAGDREKKVLPAVVMEAPAEIVPGVKVRVTGLKMTAKRELTVVARCTRPRAGPGGAFVEQVWVLDEGGERVAGGRWSHGDPFGKAATLTAKFQFPKDKMHKSLTFVACTKYAVKPVTFKVKGIFRK